LKVNDIRWHWEEDMLGLVTVDHDVVHSAIRQTVKHKAHVEPVAPVGVEGVGKSEDDFVHPDFVNTALKPRPFVEGNSGVVLADMDEIPNEDRRAILREPRNFEPTSTI